MPSSMVKFYNTLDDTLAGNNSTDTGIKLKTAKVPLPDLPCYRDNDLEFVEISYMDPEHYIESIPSRYTLADMIFPDERLEFPTSGINDFHTSRRIIRMTAEVRQKYKNKKLNIKIK